MHWPVRDAVMGHSLLQMVKHCCAWFTFPLRGAVWQTQSNPECLSYKNATKTATSVSMLVRREETVVCCVWQTAAECLAVDSVCSQNISSPTHFTTCSASMALHTKCFRVTGFVANQSDLPRCKLASWEWMSTQLTYEFISCWTFIMHFTRVEWCNKLVR